MAFQSRTGPQYTGYPALMFWGLADWGKNNQTVQELVIRLEKMHSHLNAKLPIILDYDDEKFEAIERKAATARTDDEKLIIKIHSLMNKNGDPKEGEIRKALDKMATMGIEKDSGVMLSGTEFTLILFGIFERIDQIVAMVDLIEKKKRNSQKLPPGDKEEEEDDQE